MHNRPNNNTQPQSYGRMGLPPAGHREWAAVNRERYEHALLVWKASIEDGEPNAGALLHAVQSAYGWVINTLDAMDAGALTAADLAEAKREHESVFRYAVEVMETGKC